MSAYFYKRGRGLFPADEDGARGLLKMGDGECVEVTIVRPRSLQWHKMYKAICQLIGENQDPRRDGDSVDYELRLLAGHYDVYKFDGKEMHVPKRIAFAKLSAEKWAELWPSLELAICQRFGSEYIEESRKRA